MNYFIGDLHLFNRNQTGEGVNYDGRPFATVAEMNQYILEHWNAKITNGDTVYILGDMAMRGRNEALIALVAQLKGRKILFRGNHDDLSDYRYQKLFADITDYREISESFDGQSYKLCLMHYPILMWNGQHRGSILLYAHTHNTVEETFFQKCVKELNENKKLSVQQGKPIRAINVGCMMPYMKYEPRTLKEILYEKGIRPMCPKELFLSTIENIQKQEARIDEFNTALSKICDGFPVFDSENQYLIALRELLKYTMQDQYDYIGWWLYEAPDAGYTVWWDDEDGKEIRVDLTEPGALYDYLVEYAAPEGVQEDEL